MRASEFLRSRPERLLLQAQAKENKRWGAKLKIFLGYAPGVGKSYRMLDEARRRHDRGEDVVVGAVQGRRSEDVQMILSKLESISPLETAAGQAVDVDAILRRAPKCASSIHWLRRILREAAICTAGKMCKTFSGTAFLF